MASHGKSSGLLFLIYNIAVLPLIIGHSQGTFVETLDACISLHNHKTLTGTTLAQCKDGCLRETDFCCRSFDFLEAESKCHLSWAWSKSVAVTSPCYGSPDYYERVDPDCPMTSTPPDFTTQIPLNHQQHTTPPNLQTQQTNGTALTKQETTMPPVNKQETTEPLWTELDTTVTPSTLSIQHTTEFPLNEKHTTETSNGVMDSTETPLNKRGTTEALDTTETQPQDTLSTEAETYSGLNTESITETLPTKQDTTEAQPQYTLSTKTYYDTKTTEQNLQDITETPSAKHDTTETQPEDATETELTEHTKTTPLEEQDTATTLPITQSTTEDVPVMIARLEGNVPRENGTLRKLVPLVQVAASKYVPVEAEGAEYIGSTELILLILCALTLLISDLNAYRIHLDTINGIVYVWRKHKNGVSPV